MPKIYITQLPTDSSGKEPEIFLAKRLNETSDKPDNENEDDVLNSGLLLDTLNKKFKNNVVIGEDILEPAMRSDHINQDGIKNVNAMIYNSQIVNNPMGNMKTVNEDHQSHEIFTQSPHYEFVSSSSLMPLDKLDIAADDSSTLAGFDNIQSSIAVSQGGFLILKDEDWVVPFIIVASFVLLFVTTFFCFFFFKVRRRLSCLNVMDALLAITIIAAILLTSVFTMKPTQTVCTVMRLGSGSAPAFIHSLVLVKMIVLAARSKGVHLHIVYQLILLTVSVLIQVTVVTQWLLAYPPTATEKMCGSFHQLLHGHIYSLVILALLALFSGIFRKVSSMSKEFCHLVLVTVLSVITWSVWLMTGLMVSETFSSLITSTSLIVFSTIVTCAFLPIKDNKKERQGAISPDELSVGNSSDNTSLFSVSPGESRCCSGIQNLFTRNHDNEAQNAVVKLLISKTFGSQRKTVFSDADNSGVDGDIYFSTEKQAEGGLTIQSRSQTLDQLARTVLGSNSGQHLSSTCDRFPFSSRPPQFDQNGVNGSKIYGQTNKGVSPIPSVYGQTNKGVPKSKPSLSNPNVLFCKPEEVPRTIIY